MKIKVAEGSSGTLFHDKTGCFTDQKENFVTFRGSGNETFSGWSEFGNFETLEVFCSWETCDSERAKNHRHYLQQIWNNEFPNLTVLPISKVPAEKIIKLARDDIDDFIPNTAILVICVIWGLFT